MEHSGAFTTGSGTTFKVWAPEKKSMKLDIKYPTPATYDMERGEDGYFQLTLPDVTAGARYFYCPEGEGHYPDPASHYQPTGVHEASQVVNHESYQWQDDAWRGIPFDELVLYELHVGTFTPEGTFEAIIGRLDDLAGAGINALELMPVSEFPGNRNWGYDGVYPYSVHSSYGGPEGLKKLVDAAHAKGIAVLLDVVFNHLGPEGTYLQHFGPYFTDEYVTPWGRAINMDGDWSDGVRDYFSNAVLHWYKHYHLDGLRIDAIHTIYDKGAVHFWELVDSKLQRARQEVGRPFYMIAESDLNSPRVVKSPEMGGYGFTAQWLDDFHHALYVLVDKEGKERYVDFGRTEQVAKAITDGFVHSGEYVRFRKRKHGASSAGMPGDKFVIFNQNHDQIGNRVGGERLCMLVGFERVKVAHAALFLSPYIPMLFMGEEYGDDSPFFYFVSHSDEELINMVVEGRKKEFEGFAWDREPANPQDEDTFQQSKLHWEKRSTGKYKVFLAWHKTLINLRRNSPALRNFNKNGVHVDVIADKAFVMTRTSEDEKSMIAVVYNLSDEQVTWTFPKDLPRWSLLLDSADPKWGEDAEWNEVPELHYQQVAYKISVPGAGVKVLLLEQSESPL